MGTNGTPTQCNECTYRRTYFFFGTTACKSGHFFVISTFLFVSISEVCRLRLFMLELGVKNLLRALNKPEVQYYWSQLLRYPCWMNDAKLWQDSPVKEPIRQRERRQQWVVTQPYSPQHTHKIGGFSRKESLPAKKTRRQFLPIAPLQLRFFASDIFSCTRFFSELFTGLFCNSRTDGQQSK